jgi:hypothetical protein
MFYRCSGLTSVTIPSSVTNFRYDAFSDCTNLTSITVDDANTTYRSIDGVVFDKAITTLLCCPGGKSGVYTIPSSVTSIEYYAFYYCTSLISVNIPSSVTSIGEHAFYYCAGLTSITVDDANTAYCSVDDALLDKARTTLIYCPEGKTGTYIIPSSVTNIGSYAFCSCSGLTSVTIPSSVTNIGSFGFYRCSALTKISIPALVTDIGNAAFYGCSSLANITVNATTPPTLDGLYVFSENKSGRYIYVPSASVDTYKSATNWSSYASYIVSQ